MPGRKKEKQIFHINMLKDWHPRERRVQQQLFARAMVEEEVVEGQYFPVVQSKEAELDLSRLSKFQQRASRACITEGLFSKIPGQTQLVEHHFTLKAPGSVRLPCYRIPAQLLTKDKQEIDTMREMGIIEPSSSEWSSPVVLVPRKDGSLRFCYDFLLDAHGR